MKEVKLVKCKPITYCKFCKALGIRRRCTVMTKYQPRYQLRDWYKHYSCDEHKELIEDPDPHGFAERMGPVIIDPTPRKEHYTEADYQTWMKL